MRKEKRALTKQQRIYHGRDLLEALSNIMRYIEEKSIACDVNVEIGDGVAGCRALMQASLVTDNDFMEQVLLPGIDRWTRDLMWAPDFVNWEELPGNTRDRFIRPYTHFLRIRLPVAKHIRNQLYRNRVPDDRTMTAKELDYYRHRTWP